MTAFRPGQSPPPVSTPIRMGATLDAPVGSEHDLLDRRTGHPGVRMSVLAIDAGTTGVTALVVDETGAVVARGYEEFPQHFPQPGCASTPTSPAPSLPGWPRTTRRPGPGSPTARSWWARSTAIWWRG